MTNLTLPRLPWLRRAEAQNGQRLRLHFRPRLGDWGLVLLFGPVPVVVFAVLRVKHLPLANESSEKGTWPMVLLVAVCILAAGGGALWNLFNHWCVLDIDRSQGAQRISAWGSRETWFAGALEGVHVCHYVTAGRSSQHVCEISVKTPEGFLAMHRCFGDQAERFSVALVAIVKEAGMWVEGGPS